MKIEVLFERKLLWIGAPSALCAFGWALAEWANSHGHLWALLLVCIIAALAAWAGTVLVASILLTPVAWYLDARNARGATREEAVALVAKNFIVAALWVAAYFCVRKIITWTLDGMALEYPIAASVAALLLSAALAFGAVYGFYYDRKQRKLIPVVDISASRDVQLK